MVEWEWQTMNAKENRLLSVLKKKFTDKKATKRQAYPPPNLRDQVVVSKNSREGVG